MASHEYQSHNALERRRRQIEKAKAAHLSRQLQTRLQYARLKVDHGWQKQTLNEVENLYFHHYRARLPLRKTQKTERGLANTQEGPFSTPQTVPMNVETSSSQIQPLQPQPEPEPVAPDPQSSTIIPTDEDGTYEMDVDYNPDVQESSPVVPPAASPVIAAESPTHPPAPPTITPPTPRIAPAPHPPPPSSPAVPNPTNQQPPKPPLQTPPSPLPQSESESASKTTYTGTLPYNNTKPTPIVPPPPARKLPIPRLPSVAYGTATQPRSRPRPQPARPTFSPSPSPSSGIGLANAALTYDSFWSSHSAVSPSSMTSISTSSRSAQASAPYPSLGRAGGGVSLASLPAGYSFMGTTSSTFPISQGPGVARKPAAVPAATAAAGMHGGTGAG
ncbi:hypothetical protein BU17DRAFT_101458 [Hysterangium stoloniferum]|nr:hypothetical protein BU17DRAFT_101458 [Hysterangium stoloniferum]